MIAAEFWGGLATFFKSCPRPRKVACRPLKSGTYKQAREFETRWVFLKNTKLFLTCEDFLSSDHLWLWPRRQCQGAAGGCCVGRLAWVGPLLCAGWISGLCLLEEVDRVCLWQILSKNPPPPPKPTPPTPHPETPSFNRLTFARFLKEEHLGGVPRVWVRDGRGIRAGCPGHILIVKVALWCTSRSIRGWLWNSGSCVVHLAEFRGMFWVHGCVQNSGSCAVHLTEFPVWLRNSGSAAVCLTEFRVGRRRCLQNSTSFGLVVTEFWMGSQLTLRNWVWFGVCPDGMPCRMQADPLQWCCWHTIC